MEQKAKIPKKYDIRKRDRLKAVEIFTAMVLVFFIVFRFILGISWVSGVSMRPTMVNGDMVMYFRLEKDYALNDVVAIKMPSGDFYIKRIAALPGDTVDMKDGVLYINGEPEKSAFAKGLTYPQEESVQFPCTLRPNQYFVLGDNREESIDSRTYGPASTAQIRGRIFLHLPMPWSAK